MLFALRSLRARSLAKHRFEFAFASLRNLSRPRARFRQCKRAGDICATDNDVKLEDAQSRLARRVAPLQIFARARICPPAPDCFREAIWLDCLAGGARNLAELARRLASALDNWPESGARALLELMAIIRGALANGFARNSHPTFMARRGRRGRAPSSLAALSPLRPALPEASRSDLGARRRASRTRSSAPSRRDDKARRTCHLPGAARKSRAACATSFVQLQLCLATNKSQFARRANWTRAARLEKAFRRMMMIFVCSFRSPLSLSFSPLAPQRISK